MRLASDMNGPSRALSPLEQRATRLTQTALTLMTLAFLAAGFVAVRLRVIDAPLAVWMPAVLVAVAPIVLLGMSLLQSLGVDRVSLVDPPEPGPAAAFDGVDEQRRDLVRQEVRAAATANWTAGKKVNEFLQARAWLTRAVTALIVSGVLAAGIWAFTD